jgi:precorrin-2 dehydrogenase/sirohydrochlorin ferrochelatase
VKYYPIFLRLEGKRVLVVGGGMVAERKVRSLLEAGASVEVVARELSLGLKALIDESRIRFVAREFEPWQLDGISLLILATDDPGLNAKIAEIASGKGIWVNVVNLPELCSFVVPSLLRRGDLMVAISTGGISPAFSKYLRKRLESCLPEATEGFLSLMARVREVLLPLGLGSQKNKEILEGLVSSPLMSLLETRDMEGVKAELKKLLPKSMDLDSLLSCLGQ